MTPDPRRVVEEDTKELLSDLRREIMIGEYVPTRDFLYKNRVRIADAIEALLKENAELRARAGV